MFFTLWFHHSVWPPPLSPSTPPGSACMFVAVIQIFKWSFQMPQKNFSQEMIQKYWTELNCITHTAQQPCGCWPAGIFGQLWSNRSTPRHPAPLWSQRSAAGYGWRWYVAPLVRCIYYRLHPANSHHQTWPLSVYSDHTHFASGESRSKRVTHTHIRTHRHGHTHTYTLTHMKVSTCSSDVHRIFPFSNSLSHMYANTYR